VIRARDEEIAHAISTIFLFNIGAVFLFPALGHLMGMTDAGFGLFAGTAINDTSSVVAAAAAWSQTAGSNEALTMATIVKLTRTLMIIPITLALSLMTNRRERVAAGENQVGKKADYSMARIFPWFIIGFLGASLIHTVLPMPELSGWLVGGGKFLIIVAMAGIGWNTNTQKTADQWFSVQVLLGRLLLVFCFRRIDNPSKDLDDVVIYMLSGIIESTEYVRHPQYRLLTELKGWDQYGREKDKA